MDERTLDMDSCLALAIVPSLQPSIAVNRRKLFRAPSDTITIITESPPGPGSGGADVIANGQNSEFSFLCITVYLRSSPKRDIQ